VDGFLLLMRRRDFLWMMGGTSVACSIGCSTPAPNPPTGDEPDANPTSPVDANSGVDACAQAVVTMHDTYAQALYLDGTHGPLTGVVAVSDLVAGTAITLDFWHGHGGQLHRFTLEPQHFDELKQGHRVTVGTTTVDNHAHTLFIDPLDEEYRVPGAPDVEVSLGRCEEP
jgi:hypothetical protein